ncbi:MAG TPA: rod shape-determining protein MreC [Anaerolineales bacterium]|nr:rod shape-determining protein MreC [Anaerolineales bacterium]
MSRSLRTIVISLIVVGVLALALGGYLAPLTRVFVEPLVEVQAWVSTRYVAIRDFFVAPRDLAALRQENADLEGEVARLQVQVIELQQQNAEIQILSALVDFARQNPAGDYVAASVIGRDPSPFLHYILINRGSDDGIRRGMPVVTSQGLVGRIAAVTAGASRVQLLTDPEMVVNIVLQTADEPAVLRGSLSGEISLDMISPEVNIEAGDLILTSGLGGSYPADLLIGQVSSVRTRSFDLFQTASVQPVVDFDELDIVLIIRNFRPVDISPLVP